MFNNYKISQNLLRNDSSDLYYTVGNVIKTYIYNAESKSFNTAPDYIPIFANEKLYALAVKASENNYFITSSLVEELSEYVTLSSINSLIYDDNTCYIYNGYNLYSIYSKSEFVLKNDSLLMESNISLPLLSDNKDSLYYKQLDLNSSPSRLGAYVSVVKTPQGVFDKICWAACIACVVNYNYPNNIPHTAASIAADRFGNSYYNYGLEYFYYPSVLTNYGVLGYTSINYTPSVQVMYNNINNNAPIIASFFSGEDHHATVVYGVDTNNIISVMDPADNGSFMSISYSYYEYWDTPDQNKYGYFYYDTKTTKWLKYVRSCQIYT